MHLKPRSSAASKYCAYQLGRGVEHGGSGAVDREGFDRRTEQARDRQAGMLSQDVPKRDLDGADHLCADAVPAEIAVEQHCMSCARRRMSSGSLPRRLRAITSSTIVSHDRRIGMTVVAARLAVADDAGVRFDPDHRIGSLHRRMCFRVAQKHGRNVQRSAPEDPPLYGLDAQRLGGTPLSSPTSPPPPPRPGGAAPKKDQS